MTSFSRFSSSYHGGGRRRIPPDSRGACWRNQCSRCKDFFLGSPADGRQCYRQMSAGAEFCLDMSALVFDDCSSSGGVGGDGGGAAFFAVQPKFLNVDVRIVLDVGGPEGAEVDVYLAHDPRALRFETDRKTWRQIVTIVDLDQEEEEDEEEDVSFGTRRPKRKVAGGSDVLSSFLRDGDRYEEAVDDSSVYQEIGIRDKKRRKNHPSLLSTELDLRSGFRRSLSTFVPVPAPPTRSSVTVLRGLRHRAVLSLPEAEHDLRSAKFFLAIVSAGNVSSSSAFGAVSFRQDQLHIDLFVFFSVFFAAFFLFLSVCVVIWRLQTAR